MAARDEFSLIASLTRSMSSRVISPGDTKEIVTIQKYAEAAILRHTFFYQITHILSNKSQQCFWVKDDNFQSSTEDKVIGYSSAKGSGQSVTDYGNALALQFEGITQISISRGIGVNRSSVHRSLERIHENLKKVLLKHIYQ